MFSRDVALLLYKLTAPTHPVGASLLGTNWSLVIKICTSLRKLGEQLEITAGPLLL